VYHVLNRANARLRIFHKDADYVAFENVLAEAVPRVGMRLLAYCLLPNHWHLVLWPRHDGELSRFMAWLTLTHTQRWHAHRHTVGAGHLYQGRFKSFPVQDDPHYLTVVRYVERNAQRAGLVTRAEAWRWGSLWQRAGGARGADVAANDASGPRLPPLSDGPLPLPSGWIRTVNTPLTVAEEQALQRSIARGRPFGDAPWQSRTAKRLGLESTLRERGRPKKQE
jgi:putative transposase